MAAVTLLDAKAQKIGRDLDPRDLFPVSFIQLCCAMSNCSFPSLSASILRGRTFCSRVFILWVS